MDFSAHRIRRRHVAGPHEKHLIFAIAAARTALADGKRDASSIDVIVVATTTPDNTFPATAVRVTTALGISQDLRWMFKRCVRVIYALAVADIYPLGKLTAPW